MLAITCYSRRQTSQSLAPNLRGQRAVCNQERVVHRPNADHTLARLPGTRLLTTNFQVIINCEMRFSALAKRSDKVKARILQLQ